jgi:hypothetical protein
MIASAACDTGDVPAAPAASSSGPSWQERQRAADGAPRVTKAEDVPQIATPRAPSPTALKALVEAAPEVESKPTGDDGQTLVGSDTGREEEDEALIPLPRPAPRVRGGEVEIQPQMSSPAIERQARAQIYWDLRRCKEAGGRPPPPESITLAFTLREDGTVDPASVTATAADDRLHPVAECVLREFSSTPFEGPPAARRTPARIVITWPSVD